MYTDRRRGRTLIWVIVFVIASLLLSLIGGQLIQIWLNFQEFGDLYVRPFYFAFVGGFILSAVAFVRVDIRNRRSLLLWILRTVIFGARGGGVFNPRLFDFDKFKLSVPTFLVWQLTKLLVGATLLSNAIFGMALLASVSGWNAGLQHVISIFGLPFAQFEQRVPSGTEAILPAAPALTLLVPSVLGAISIRLIILVGITQLVRLVAGAVVSYAETGVATVKTYILEGLAALALGWTTFNLFFTNYIDFNTRVVIIGALAATVIFAVYAYWDSKKPPLFRNFYLRLGALVIVALAVGSAITVQSSIADAQKLEWRGPYVSQEIAMNRFLAQLDQVQEKRYNFTAVSIPIDSIDAYIRENQYILSRIRLWDWDAAFAKLKPEIGLIPYVDFEDSDILRFNGTLYWSASMKPVLPPTVTSGDRWYNEHLVYSHIPQGFLMLDAHKGTVVDSGAFFGERRIYYGEGGERSLFSSTWAAMVQGRQTIDEINGEGYTGRGGLLVSPPVSWLYDITFFLSYPDRSIRLIRYRDVHERVELILPYFNYRWNGEWVDMLPVTDGTNSYWLMPLIISLPTEHLPWSKGNPFMRLVGYALVDVYNGDMRIILVGQDFFSTLFGSVYSEYVTTEIPSWLEDQLRYPSELFLWRVEMFNTYHIVDPATFIQAREFYEIPSGVDPYYVEAAQTAHSETEFIGLLSLEVRGAKGQNLAGYMIVRNDRDHLGDMVFYSVPLESDTKLLGPSAARQALERDPAFKTIRTLLTADPSNPPRIGENIFYQIGQYPVYFIPVYSAQAGGVVTQIGTIAAVGASFTGQYYVGLGQSSEEAFRNFLIKLSGETAPPTGERPDRAERISAFLDLLRRMNLTVEQPEKINPHLTFLEGTVQFIYQQDLAEVRRVLEAFVAKWVEGRDVHRVIYWLAEDSLNLGTITSEDGVVVLRYVSVKLG